jgi:GntR family transcriptional repressor for pyruvate dehydrogenase complex
MEKRKASADSRDVLRQLVGLVRAQGLAVGDRLPSIRQLAASLRVNASLVRDAMVQAQAIGLVRLHPRSGAFVQSLNYASLADSLSSTLPASLIERDHNLLYLLDARRLIECETAALAAERRRVEELLPMREALIAMKTTGQKGRREKFVEADVAFHFAMAQAAGNPVLTTMVQSLLALLRPYLLGLPWTNERRSRTRRSHGEIYKAVLAGDAPRARRAVQAHLGLAREKLLDELRAPLRTG